MTETANAREQKRRVETMICSPPCGRNGNIRPVPAQETGLAEMATHSAEAIDSAHVLGCERKADGFLDLPAVVYG